MARTRTQANPSPHHRSGSKISKTDVKNSLDDKVINQSIMAQRKRVNESRDRLEEQKVVRHRANRQNQLDTMQACLEEAQAKNDLRLQSYWEGQISKWYRQGGLDG